MEEALQNEYCVVLGEADLHCFATFSQCEIRNSEKLEFNNQSTEESAR